MFFFLTFLITFIMYGLFCRWRNTGQMTRFILGVSAVVCLLTIDIFVRMMKIGTPPLFAYLTFIVALNYLVAVLHVLFKEYRPWK